MDISSSASSQSRDQRELLYTFNSHDPVSIGSDSRSCRIVIEGADPHHAELRWDADEESWFICDDPAPGKTLLNNDPIVRGRLLEDDVIEIAGTLLRFAGRKLWRLSQNRSNGIYVSVRDLTVRVKDDDVEGGWKTLLDGVSFHTTPGSFTAILGPSGCGKSTLIQRLAGLSMDGEIRGNISFNGHALSDADTELHRFIAYLPQKVEDTLHAEFTVRETMEHFSRCHLYSTDAPDFSTALKKVNLNWDELATKPVRKLSGGQKKRLALAIELLRDPHLLLLDEPTAGLDPAAEAEIMDLLRQHSGRGKTILCATHVLGSLSMCRDVLVLTHDGRVAFHGTPSDALSYFRTKFRTKDWVEVYSELGKGNWEPQPANGPGDSELFALPEPPQQVPFRRTFAATLERLGRSVLSKWNPLLFAGIPVLVSILLLFACNSLLNDPHPTNRHPSTVYFCMIVAMFWFGLSGTFRNLVSERVPKRCLDRLRGLPLGHYFAAHVAFSAIVSLVQSLLFILPIFAWQSVYGPDFTFHAFPAFWVDLALVGFSGGCVGLAVSACAKKELYAAWALPLVAIPALFLSKPVLGFDRGEPPKPASWLLRKVECCMPTLYPQTVLETSMERAKVYFVMPDPDDLDRVPPEELSRFLAESQRMSVENWTKRRHKLDRQTGAILKDKAGNPQFENSHADEHVNDVLRFFALVAGYALISLTAAFWLEDWRERQWDGR